MMRVQFPYPAPKRANANMLKFYNTFPKGIKSRLKIIALDSSDAHELGDYKLASRHEFYDAVSCTSYARELAMKHGITLKSDEEEVIPLLGGDF